MEPVAVPVAVGWGADGVSRLAAVRERIADPAAVTKTVPIRAAITEPSPRSDRGHGTSRCTGSRHGHGPRSGRGHRTGRRTGSGRLRCGWRFTATAVRERVADPAAATKTVPIQAAITEPSPRSGNGHRARRRTGGGHGTRSPFRRWSRTQSSVQTAITEPSRRSGDGHGTSPRTGDGHGTRPLPRPRSRNRSLCPQRCRCRDADGVSPAGGAPSGSPSSLRAGRSLLGVGIRRTEGATCMPGRFGPKGSKARSTPVNDRCPRSESNRHEQLF